MDHVSLTTISQRLRCDIMLKRWFQPLSGKPALTAWRSAMKLGGSSYSTLTSPRFKDRARRFTGNPRVRIQWPANVVRQHFQLLCRDSLPCCIFVALFKRVAQDAKYAIDFRARHLSTASAQVPQEGTLGSETACSPELQRICAASLK